MIAFFLQESPHTGARIWSAILEKLRGYNIKNKIIVITLDNASSYNVATELLKSALQLNFNGAIFYNRCVCHSMNFIVQEGVKSIKDVLEIIKWIVGFIFWSPL